MGAPHSRWPHLERYDSFPEFSICSHQRWETRRCFLVPPLGERTGLKAAEGRGTTPGTDSHCVQHGTSKKKSPPERQAFLNSADNAGLSIAHCPLTLWNLNLSPSTPPLCKAAFFFSRKNSLASSLKMGRFFSLSGSQNGHKKHIEVTSCKRIRNTCILLPLSLARF